MNGAAPHFFLAENRAGYHRRRHRTRTSPQRSTLEHTHLRLRALSRTSDADLIVSSLADHGFCRPNSRSRFDCLNSARPALRMTCRTTALRFACTSVPLAQTEREQAQSSTVQAQLSASARLKLSCSCCTSSDALATVLQILQHHCSVASMRNIILILHDCTLLNAAFIPWCCRRLCCFRAQELWWRLTKSIFESVILAGSSQNPWYASERKEGLILRPPARSHTCSQPLPVA